MTFKKVNPKEKIRKAVNKNPILVKELEKADKAYEEMKRKNGINEINLEIENVEVCKDFIRISWSSDIGFGEYDLIKEDDEWCAMSECMDSNEDKEFIEKLLQLFVKKLNIIE